MKKCSKCKRVLPLDDFGKNTANRNGLQSQCRYCRQLRYTTHRGRNGQNPIAAGAFWSQVEKTDGCWTWLGRKYPSGYGRFRAKYAHRLAYELARGPIPDGLCVCHTCDNPPCVNPDHLWLGTHQDNMRDRNIKGRTAKQSGRTNARKRNASKLLTDQQILEIRRRYIPGQVTQIELAKEYGISKRFLWDIVTRRRWAWLED